MEKLIIEIIGMLFRNCIGTWTRGTKKEIVGENISGWLEFGQTVGLTFLQAKKLDRTIEEFIDDIAEDFLKNFGNELEKIRLQKLLFLLAKNQIKPEYDFIPYKYGCYSFSANADLNAREKMNPNGKKASDSIYSYPTTEKYNSNATSLTIVGTILYGENGLLSSYFKDPNFYDIVCDFYFNPLTFFVILQC